MVLPGRVSDSVVIGPLTKAYERALVSIALPAGHYVAPSNAEMISFPSSSAEKVMSVPNLKQNRATVSPLGYGVLVATLLAIAILVFAFARSVFIKNDPLGFLFPASLVVLLCASLLAGSSKVLKK
ncbi:hypothetical protein HFO74_29370 [Rhizobium laguerreae]|uniref:Uncharacterized protein n=1 Tax=Rhizobium laguerreae TaxID=1076926 RepID=A0AB35FLP1_9HYPH|nr:hypothetical protein [Rhizobium laguerreae]MBY3067483.1 hypothetical protein [Rhizobium laguerreae]